MLIDRLCIIGVGLIGGSLARALRQAGVVSTVVGCSRDEAHLAKARQLGVIDEYATGMAEAVQGADMVVIAVPMQAMRDVFASIKDHLGPETVITDVGSVKGSAVEAAKQVFGEVPARYIPGHPIAGTEKNGVEASFAELYQNRRVIITPLPDSDQAAVNLVSSMWQSAGAEVISMGVEHHDEVLAATSHLPHMLAYALVDTLARMDDKQEIFSYAAGGFRDFTRIASSNPQMWHDICLANQSALQNVLHRFRDDLQMLIEAIEKGDSLYLKETFTRAKLARDKFVSE